MAVRWAIDDMTQPMTAPFDRPMGRDPRLDALRGLALVMIFVNHVPGNAWSNYTSRNFGLSDAAEGFVLIAGISAALAYGHWFQPGQNGSLRQMMIGLGHVWHRVWTIYLVQILATVLTLGVILAVARWFDDLTMLHINRMDAFRADPVGAMLRIPVLIQQLDYVDILPMYLVLLFWTPLALWLAWRGPWLLFAGAIALWWVTVTYRINLPNHPNPAGWFFNPLAWQLLFVIGLLAGVAMRRGRSLVPKHPVLLIIALALLLGSVAWLQVPQFGEYMYGLMWQAQQVGTPDYLTSFEKTFLPLPRLLHVLVLAYALACFDGFRRICASVFIAPFRLLGQQGLLVFSAGSVICVGLQAVRQRTGGDLGQDSAMLGAGLLVLFALAAAKQYWPKSAPVAKARKWAGIRPAAPT